MVDFQSRDTRRRLDDDEPEDDEAADEAGGTEAPEGEQPAEPGSDAEPGAGEAGTTDPPAPSAAVPGGGELAYALVTVGEPGPGVDPADAAVAALDGTPGSVESRRTVASAYDPVQSAVVDTVEQPDVTAVLTLGGVGVGPDDIVPEAVGSLFDRTLDGFGELYRVPLHEQEGTAVVRARVTAGLVGPVPVFCLPGDPEAVRRAVSQLVVAEARPIVKAAAGGQD